ncbi:MAG: hypothetical protein AAGF15_12420, partial [Pseudomonadota bacterium]
LTEESFALESAQLEAGFISGQEFVFESLGLAIDNIETVIFSVGLGFDDVIAGASDVLGDELVDQLADADLFGFI